MLKRLLGNIEDNIWEASHAQQEASHNGTCNYYSWKESHLSGDSKSRRELKPSGEEC